MATSVIKADFRALSGTWIVIVTRVVEAAAGADLVYVIMGMAVVDPIAVFSAADGFEFT